MKDKTPWSIRAMHGCSSSMLGVFSKGQFLILAFSPACTSNAGGKEIKSHAYFKTKK